MLNARHWENELWDDDCLEVGKIFHSGCGGRVFWIQSDEFRCLGCCEVVILDRMEVECGATTHEE